MQISVVKMGMMRMNIEDYGDTIYLLQKTGAIFKIISNEKKKKIDI